uniref:Glucoamylase TGA n=1 Tax=Thermoactinomyces vulgaris TaxID=2026 RepID=Q9KWR2_THEVU|nr:glucoamylase TGA [Thermoactinomyces vulgaris]BAB40639.1 glucoamylase TGA [Thermoactinomyces vulgaris]
MANKRYLIDAVIGNDKILAVLDRYGELHRLWWPQKDYAQHVNRLSAGVLIPGKSKGVWWFHQPAGKHEQTYVHDAPILRTTATCREWPLEVVCEDEVVSGRNVLMRHYVITNCGEEEIPLQFVSYTSFHMGEMKRYNTTLFVGKKEALVHYRREFAVAVGSVLPTTRFAAGSNKDHIDQGLFNCNDIAMHTDGGCLWELGLCPPGESKCMTLFFAFGKTVEKALEELEEARTLGFERLRSQTLADWEAYFGQAKPVQTGCEEMDRLYRRSLAVFRLMTDGEYGSMIAGPEFDEDFVRCGGYAYCWGRDAAYIATAIDRAGYHDRVRAFYRWAMQTQSRDGSWQQRHYLDGRLAPQWGLQIDETGSILWGMWQHYLLTNDRAFLDEIWESVQKAAQFLILFIDPETGLPLPSRDLWEEREGEHTYSASAVCGGLDAAAAVADKLGEKRLAQNWKEAAGAIRRAVEEKCWDPERQVFYRGLKLMVPPEEWAHAEKEGKRGMIHVDEKGISRPMLWQDPVIDISLVGISVPFNLIAPDDERMVKMAEAIETHLTSPIVGGIKRYENDPYVGGNPWILTTLWLAQLYIKQGRIKKALNHLKWVVDHRTDLDLLPEQVDRETGKAAWVVPLTWSHAMFVLTVLDLLEIGAIGPKKS